MRLIVSFFRFVLISIFCLSCAETKKSTTDKNTAIQKTPDANLTETYWKLTELMGKPVAITPADKKEVHLKLRKEGSRVEGFGGCNGFGSTFVTRNNFNISFGTITSTMIACPELDLENELFNVLKTVDNYFVKGDTLSFSKAKMATMARFVAVYFH